ncbi:hypothetical protein J2Y68_003866 [Paenarthrobacter nitroguajacolicus]|nr:hypothetical protein [Paenarthrobacter nitroguajacolicus]
MADVAVVAILVMSMGIVMWVARLLGKMIDGAGRVSGQ